MKKLKSELLHKGKWLKLFRSTFENSRGKTYEWEHLEHHISSNAVVMIATLQPSNRYLLIKQFRAGYNGLIIGLPAGMSDNGGKDPAEDAIRELKEETGYVGVVDKISPPLISTPAISPVGIQVVHMSVDETLEANLNPVQELEDSEDIEVLRIPVEEVKEYLTDIADKGDMAIASAVWYILGTK